MKQRCETCKHFKYVESNIYGRCQYRTADSVLDGIPRIPWAMACESYQAKAKLNKTNLDEDHEMGRNITQKQTQSNNDTAAYTSTEVKSNCTKS